MWKLAHAMYREYDNIFLDDLVLTDMCRKWKKMGDYAHYFSGGSMSFSF